jgi:hypothetical protein
MAFAPEEEFSRQRITITVPASFDEDAQALTRLAAEQAGMPRTVRLLEEPQAAFYAWIEGASQGRTDAPRARFIEHLPDLAERNQVVLVCDIGGGTSDFSLFEIYPPESPKDLPRIERVAVSDHLLLGGDNMDLALAHAIERILKPDPDDRLSRRQWNHLVPQARVLKERILSGMGASDEEFHVSIPGEGASLFQSALSTTFRRSEVQRVILDGFFPVTNAEEQPATRQSGLREIGLPYAADSAISRHLAAFLNGRAVDAVLFAGGSLQPAFLRERLLKTIAAWQDRLPVELILDDMSLAIARGAAYFGAILESAKQRIRGGHARGVYLELHREVAEVTPDLVCILPQGAEEGGVTKLASPRFDLLLNKPARFTAYTSIRRRGDRAGAIVKLDDKDFHPLPPLHTTLTFDESAFDARKALERRVQVELEIGLTELGVLQLALVSAERQKHWRLDFNLRKQGIAAPASSADDPGVDPEALRRAGERINLFYGKKQAVDEKQTVKTLMKDLERILGQERGAWGVGILRGLWPVLYQGMTRRGRSLAHENTWLYLAGFVLRPGYGAELDAWRIAQLWSCYALGITHKKEKSAQSNWWMLWRRVAGGLSAEQQELLFNAAIPQLRKSPLEFSEGARLLGALERVPVARKLELVNSVFDLLLKGRVITQPHIYWALTRLLSRLPLYTAAESVVPPTTVEDFFARVEPMDWKKQGLTSLVQVFSSACRLTGTRGLDIHDPVRVRVLEKLRQSGAKEEQLRIVRERCEITAEEQTFLFGEELPAGLRLAEPRPT